jgi:hypothetical protein
MRQPSLIPFLIVALQLTSYLGSARPSPGIVDGGLERPPVAGPRVPGENPNFGPLAEPNG